MSDMILDMLKGMDRKIDGIKNDIADMKIKDLEQGHRLDAIEKDILSLINNDNIMKEQIKKIEGAYTAKEDIDALFARVRKLEEAPQVRLNGKIDFVKKAILAGVALLITSVVVFLGRFMWITVLNMTAIAEIIEKLK